LDERIVSFHSGSPFFARRREREHLGCGEEVKTVSFGARKHLSFLRRLSGFHFFSVLFRTRIQFNALAGANRTAGRIFKACSIASV
jgi:hypothetical protein